MGNKAVAIAEDVFEHTSHELAAVIATVLERPRGGNGRGLPALALSFCSTPRGSETAGDTIDMAIANQLYDPLKTRGSDYTLLGHPDSGSSMETAEKAQVPGDANDGADAWCVIAPAAGPAPD